MVGDCGGMTIAELEASLAEGWDWLAANSAHPKHDEFEHRWVARLRRYETCYRGERRVANPEQATITGMDTAQGRDWTG